MSNLFSTSANPITMGLWQASGDVWQYDDQRILDTLSADYDAGIRCFDTARAYGNGHAETLLGKVLKPQRERIFIASKVMQKLNYNQVMNACRASLKCLQTDSIDLLYIHWPSGSFGERTSPIAETLKAFNALKKTGKICAIGVSNFTLAQLKESQQYAQIDAVQNPYSLIWQCGQDVLAYCQQHDIHFFAYSALASGLLTGKYPTAEKFQASQPLRQYLNLGMPTTFARLQPVLHYIEKLSQQYQTTPANIALAWLIQHGIFPVCGATRPAQIVSNAQAADLALNAEECQTLTTLG